MALSSSQNDLTACSICFEKFRIPRCLPCSHLFCHGCLSSYIVTSCASKEAPIGFACPLCREFIPSTAPTDKPENWADKFPICEMLEKCNNLLESRFCSACQRGNEEEEATSICLTCEDALCVLCTKCHRQNRASSTHELILINERNILVPLTTAVLKNENCEDHPDRKVELYCDDHSKSCCTLCASTRHRKCDSIVDIQKAVETIRKSDKLQLLQEELRKYEAELQKAKQNNEGNITKIDNTTDLITEETKKLKTEIFEHLNKLESKHQDELSTVMKESRDTLNKKIDSLSDRIQLTRHCSKCLQEVKVETGASFMMQYQKIQGYFEQMRKQNLSKTELKFKIVSNAAKELEQIKSAVLHLKLQVTKFVSLPLRDLNLSTAQFSRLYDFDKRNLNVLSGTFLPDGTFIIANFQGDDIGLINYSVTNDTSTSLRTFYSNCRLFDICCVEDELYVTDNTNQRVIVISNDNFTSLREFSVRGNLYPHGIVVWEKFLFVACQTAILKYDMQGNLIHSYPVQNGVAYVLVMESGQIVYSNSDTHKVRAMDFQGNPLWTYSHSKLRTPYSVDKDSMNHIYVAGADSNNIHILSGSGSLIRIVEDIPRPTFMKVKEGSNICCVCSNRKKLTVYEIE